MYIVWDINKKAIIEDWDQLINIQWNGWAFAAAAHARHLNLRLQEKTMEAENEWLTKEEVVLSAMCLFNPQINDLVCSGSASGDLHLFRYAALKVDKAEIISSAHAAFAELPENKAMMALARSYNSCTSSIESINHISDGHSQWIIVCSSSDEAILKYSLSYEDCRWDWDYILSNPRTPLEDPFEELPSKEKFLLFFNENWIPRSTIGSTMKIEESSNSQKMEMRINWIFGRRAYDRRNNVKIDYMKRIVYPAGTMLVIVKEAFISKEKAGEGTRGMKRVLQQRALHSTRSNKVFPEISCIAMSATRHIVALGTAEIQAHIYAWDISTDTEIAGVELLNITLVYCIKFHKEERFVSAVALSEEYLQVILVVDIQEMSVIARATQLHSIPFKIRDIDFCPGPSINRLVTCGVQHLAFWTLSGHYMEHHSAEMNLPSEEASKINQMPINFEEQKREGDKSVMTISQQAIEPVQKPCGALMFCKEIKIEQDPAYAYATFLGIGFIGKIMLTIADDGCIYIWENEKIIRKRHGHNGPILCMDISSLDMLVATGSCDGRVVLWVFNSNTSHGIARIDLEKIRSIHLNCIIHPSQI